MGFVPKTGDVRGVRGCKISLPPLVTIVVVIVVVAIVI